MAFRGGLHFCHFIDRDYDRVEFENPLVDWVDEALGTLIDGGVVAEIAAQYLTGDLNARVINE